MQCPEVSVSPALVDTCPRVSCVLTLTTLATVSPPSPHTAASPAPGPATEPPGSSKLFYLDPDMSENGKSRYDLEILVGADNKSHFLIGFMVICEVCEEVPRSCSTALQNSVWRLQRMGGKCPPALCNHRHLRGLDQCLQLKLEPTKNTNLQLVPSIIILYGCSANPDTRWCKGEL